jgi:deoxyribonuclease V
MNIAIDVSYHENSASAVGVLFNWQDEAPAEIISAMVSSVDDYTPGQFYKRELPCILAVLNKIQLEDINCIIIDGYVYINNDYTHGLGGHLYEALERKIPVIGVAKTEFQHNEQTYIAVVRGDSKVPLYVSAIGMDVGVAADYVKSMKGEFRMPAILKELDRLTKV